MYKDDLSLGLGLARAMQEGGPYHPDDLSWEHPPGSGCEKCQEKYNRQLKAWEEFQRKQK